MNATTRILDAARRSNPGRPEGVASVPSACGEVVVAWSRITQTYEVGTSALVLATGRRSDVLDVLTALLERP